MTLDEALKLVKQLSPLDQLKLIEQITPDIHRALSQTPLTPRKSLWGLCSDLGSAPSEADIDEIRAVEWASFAGESI